jgi:beta-aspartyl-peptidase (threonine type)
MANDVSGSWGSNGGDWAIVVHGGAGDVPARAIPARLEGCKRAASAAAKVLAEGGTALNAAQRAVEVLEDDPLFNAGTGACLTRDGTIELDASLMDGKLLRVGAVCALPAFKNPIVIARAILDLGGHVLYAGAGAERFAVERGFKRLADAELITPAARATWEKLRAKDDDAKAHNWAGGGGHENCSHGTVGAVARDALGGVAAATSTGGRMYKAVGRVGDSPIPGAGNYADDGAGACSNTGDGEAVMRLVLAKTACEWMRAGMHPEDAARAAVQLLYDRTEATGGTILVDPKGRIGLARTTAAMTWAAMAAEWDEPEAGS